MAQPNVVREPSMDEILASIRRIIESNEPVLQSGAAAAAEPEGFSGSAANDDAEEVTLTVDDAFTDRNRNYAPNAASAPAFRAIADTETHAETTVVRDLREPGFSQPGAPEQQKPLSLADVAARVRAASERTSAALRDLPASRDAHYGEQSGAAVHESQPVAVAMPEPMRVQPAPEATETFLPSSAVAPAELEQEEEQAYRPEPVSLLSSSAGEQVARSFQDLALAIDNAERRSLDQIAEDMLRPMLQEWLDDNLPTLVERLVREEIERVARGPRR